jgi:hypothetical protein
MLEAIINEDQGDLAKRLGGGVPQGGPIRPPEPFFSAEDASKVLLKLHHILRQNEPVADSVDMPMSSELRDILEAATALAQQRSSFSILRCNHSIFSRQCFRRGAVGSLRFLRRSEFRGKAC